jgi:uncharacterized protein YbjT (DUF2867 family)
VRAAVAGGTGLVGAAVVRALERDGNEAVVLARARGVDLTTGEGLDPALAGTEAVIDVTNTSRTDADGTRAFFGAVTERLLAAEVTAGVRHHVVLSIVGLDRVPSNPHYAGKLHQEALAEAGPVPVSIVRATQFHDFAGMVGDWSRRDGSARVAPLLIQPLAVSDVADFIAEVAAGQPWGRCELAGPETQDLVDMARRTLAARGEAVELVPSWRGRFGPEMAGEVLLPGPRARIAATTFEAWLATQARAVTGSSASRYKKDRSSTTPAATME